MPALGAQGFMSRSTICLSSKEEEGIFSAGTRCFKAPAPVKAWECSEPLREFHRKSRAALKKAAMRYESFQEVLFARSPSLTNEL
jgi:hypothetical protein